MARNEVHRLGQDLSLLVGTAALSGDPVRVGSINGVCQTDAANAAGTNVNGMATGNTLGYASVWTNGVWRLKVTLTAAREQGTPVYAIPNGNAANKVVTLTDVAGANKLFGVLTEAGTTGTDVIRSIKLAPITV